MEKVSLAWIDRDGAIVVAHRRLILLGRLIGPAAIPVSPGYIVTRKLPGPQQGTAGGNNVRERAVLAGRKDVGRLFARRQWLRRGGRSIFLLRHRLAPGNEAL